MKNISIPQLAKVNLGVLLVAVGFIFFLAPNDIAPGGVSGLALVINAYMPTVNIGAIMLVINVILLIVGVIFIGKSFGGMTVYGSLSLSLFMYILEALFPIKQSLTGDIFIELLFGVALSAFGMAIVFNQNSSTGGTDIVAKILNKYTGLEIGRSLLIADFVVVILALYTFDIQKGLYALLGVFMTGLMVDYVIDGFNVNKKVEIVTKDNEKVKEYIIKDLDRGATVYEARGAYTGENKEVIATVINKKEFIKLKKFIKGIDKDAFIITYNVHETIGEGFGILDDSE